MTGAIRLTVAGAPRDLEDRLFELLADIPGSWTRLGDAVSVWVDPAHLTETSAALASAGLAFTQEAEEARDFVAEAAALQRPVEVGRYLLDPHDGERATAPGERVRLHVPAERAFGTGSHESTRLAMRLLLAQDLRGKRVLDVGCGAGTLAFVAVAEGAARAVAFDVDPDAAFATRAGARRNALAGVSPFAGPIEALSLSSAFDAVFANLIAEELAPLLSGIVLRMRSGGTLVTSGQLGERRGAWEETLAAAGLSVLGSEVEGEWIGFVARKGA